MYCLLLQIFKFQLLSVLNPLPQPLPVWTIWSLRSPLYTSLHFFNTLHWSQGQSRVLAPNTLESACGRRGGIFFLFMATILLVTEFSALKQKMLSYQEVWSHFVCLFCFVVFACQFCKLPPFLGTPKVSPSPLSDPFLTLDPRLRNLLLRHCKCIMYSKHRIGRKAVELLEI